MRAKILFIIALSLLGLVAVVAVAGLNLRSIAASVQQGQETSGAVYRISVVANDQLREASAAVGALFQAKTETDRQRIAGTIDQALSGLHDQVQLLRNPHFTGVLAQPAQAGDAPVEGAETRTIAQVVEAIEKRLPEISEAAKQVETLAADQLALVGQLAQVKEELSKASRRCLDLQAVDAKAYNNLIRGVITVLSTTSGRDVKFAGKAKFEEGVEVIEKAELSPAQQTALKALKTQFETTYEVVRHYLASSADSAFFLAKAKEQTADLQLLQASTDRSFVASQDALVARSRKTIVSTLIMAGVIACISVVSGLLVARSITGRMTRTMTEVKAVAQALAAGDLTRRVPGGATDELGTMTGAMNQTLDLIRDAMRHLTEATGRLTHTAARLGEVSTALDGSATTASTKALAASTAAQQVSGNVQSVSAGIEEMSASVSEVASTTGRAASTCEEAVSKAAGARATIAKLAVSSKEIGDIVLVINSVAEQTNLLALNATIEAARAGDAGRGFAVVANEVKALAQQTSAATADIRRRVEAIRSDSALTSEAMGQIDTTVQHINTLQQSIATAVEQQAETSREIAKQLAETASGSRDIVTGAGQVADATKGTLASAGETRALADSLTKNANELDAIIKKFTC